VIVVWIILIIIVVSGTVVDTVAGLNKLRVMHRAIGVLLLILVLRASSVTGRYLSAYGRSSPNLPRGTVDRLVTVGPYSCMRHPMHFFLSLLPPSIGLIIGSPSATMIGLVETMLILALAVTVDEKESIEKFGAKYLEYRANVPAFNLSPSCLLKSLTKRPKKQVRDSAQTYS
jgi:protein-S-isoprenylcysteine O-methyltransferase Ste14